MKRASLHTLGCRLNFSETDAIRKTLEKDGYQIVPFGEEADLAVINTCTVTAHADQKCRSAIRSFVRKNPSAFTAVVGCYSQMGYKALAEIPGIDLIVGNQEKLNVLNYAAQGKNKKPLIIRDRISHDDFSIDFFDDAEPGTERANLKIQDGCDFACSFCIIPQARGRARSREFNNLIAEAQSLVNAGIQEIVLTGVNIGTYAQENRQLIDVVDALNTINGLKNLRISSIEPTTIPRELFARMNDSQHALVPYLHVPLQSGSDKILTAMRRRYTKTEYLDFLLEAHTQVKDLCFGTDILVGFPGETVEDFEESCEFFRENAFAYCHVFSYSSRDKTVAAKSTEHISENEKKRRSAVLRALSARQRQSYFGAFIGRTLPVLFEKQKDGLWPGYTPNYVRVLVRSEENLHNQIRPVKIQRICADFTEGELVAPRNLPEFFRQDVPPVSGTHPQI